jgi:hypothetical protein
MAEIESVSIEMEATFNICACKCNCQSNCSCVCGMTSDLCNFWKDQQTDRLLTLKCKVEFRQILYVCTCF